MFAPYRRLFGTRRLPALLAWSLIGRLHMTGSGIAVTFLVAGWTGSYAVAGAVVAALTLGTAIGGPLRGRTVDRRPAPRVLLVTGLAYGAGLGTIAVLPAAAWPVAVPLALLSGLVVPPVGQVVRVVWSRLPDRTVREAVYGVEATLQELLFVVGPVLVATLVAAVSPRAGVVACAALAAGGSLGFALVLHRGRIETVGATRPDQPRRRGPVLRTPGLLPLMVMMLLVVGAFTSVDLSLVAWSRARHMPALAGILNAVWAIGSGAGGLVLAGRRQRLVLRVAGVAGGLVLLAPVLPPVTGSASPWLVGTVLVLGGLAIAPTMATVNSRLGVLVPDDRRGEAFGWLATANTTGGAVVAPVMGALLDRTGPAAAVGAGALLALAAVGLATLVPAATTRAVHEELPEEPQPEVAG